MFRRVIQAATISFLIALPVTADAFKAWNRHSVNPVGNGVFEVVSKVGSTAKDYWCGAGDYAVRVLRASSNDRVYLWQEIGPAKTTEGRKGVQFSMQPQPGADTAARMTISVRRAGDNMSASLAQNFCFDRTGEEVWPL